MTYHFSSFLYFPLELRIIHAHLYLNRDFQFLASLADMKLKFTTKREPSLDFLLNCFVVSDSLSDLISIYSN